MDTSHGDNPDLARQQREERMRYEVLGMLCRASRRDPNEPVDCGVITERVGVWREELFRVFDFLVSAGLLRSCGEGPRLCITPEGIDYLYREGKRRKAIPDAP